MQSSNPITRETIRIKGGLGPIRAVDEVIELELLPVTVFIGPQGTGKSLLSQLLYFFRDAEYLLARYSEQQGPDAAVRHIVEGIRAGETKNRSLASFLTTSRAEIHYRCEYLSDSTLERRISINRESKKISALQPFLKEVQQWLEHWVSDLSAAGRLSPRALFVPAERAFYSRFINSNPGMLGHKSLPLTMREFAGVLSEAADVSDFQLGTLFEPDEAHDIEHLVRHALGGRATSTPVGLYGRRWQWWPENTDEPIELEMASSGQMEAWPLVFTAQAMFSKQQDNLPLFLHIEEPETHLHPAAQVAITKLLAYLANRNIRLIITTHSLTILYALNNLSLAYRKLGDREARNLPNALVRLAPDKVAGYLFADGSVESVVDKNGQIDEGRMGEVLGDLQVQFNRLTTYGALWE